MKSFKFVGENGPVDVPALGLVEVEPGTTVEVEDTDVSAGLDGSADWEHVPDPKRSAAAKKAAASSSDSEES